MKQNDKAIFLHRTNYSESSLIITFYCYQNGIQKFIFQGGKKKGTALFPLSLCEITFYKRSDSNLWKLTDTQSYEILQEIPSNPIKSTIAFFMVDVIKQCLQTDQHDSHLYQFLEKCILDLNKQPELSLFATRFLIDFSRHLGIDPQIQLTNMSYFHLQEGEFSSFDRQGEISASGPAVILIQKMIRKDSLENCSKSDKIEAFDIMVHYYKFHIPKFDIHQSLEVIKEILYN